MKRGRLKAAWSIGRFWPFPGALEVRLAETEHEVEAGPAPALYRLLSGDERHPLAADARGWAATSINMTTSATTFWWWTARRMARTASRWWSPPIVLTRQKDAARAGGFYTAGEYDVAPMLKGLPAETEFLELGRSCVLKSYRARPGTMQLLWKGLMAYVARFDIDLMFGCASLAGTDPEALALPLSYLHHFHAMPEDLAGAGAARIVRGDEPDAQGKHRGARGLRSLPPLLKGYMRAGCRIGDGAVIDRQFGTTDVFIYFPLSGIDARYKSRFGLVK